MTEYKRITRRDMLSDIARVVSRRSTCPRKSVGAIIVREGRVLSMGYNGTPSGLPHCHDVGCLVGPDGGCTRAQHAEANAIAFAARHGIATNGAELWTTLSPCPSCAKLIINAGITDVYFMEQYRLREGLDLLVSAKVRIFLVGINEQKP